MPGEGGKVNRYRVVRKDKIFIYNCEDAIEAAEKFSRRKVYGEKMFYGFTIKQCDADTVGLRWCQFSAGGEILLAEIDPGKGRKK